MTLHYVDPHGWTIGDYILPLSWAVVFTYWRGSIFQRMFIQFVLVLITCFIVLALKIYTEVLQRFVIVMANVLSSVALTLTFVLGFYAYRAYGRFLSVQTEWNTLVSSVVNYALRLQMVLTKDGSPEMIALEELILRTIRWVNLSIGLLVMHVFHKKKSPYANLKTLEDTGLLMASERETLEKLSDFGFLLDSFVPLPLNWLTGVWATFDRAAAKKIGLDYNQARIVDEMQRIRNSMGVILAYYTVPIPLSYRLIVNLITRMYLSVLVLLVGNLNTVSTGIVTPTSWSQGYDIIFVMLNYVMLIGWLETAEEVGFEFRVAPDSLDLDKIAIGARISSLMCVMSADNQSFIPTSWNDPEPDLDYSMTLALDCSDDKIDLDLNATIADVFVKDVFVKKKSVKLGVGNRMKVHENDLDEAATRTTTSSTESFRQSGRYIISSSSSDDENEDDASHNNAGDVDDSDDKGNIFTWMLSGVTGRRTNKASPHDSAKSSPFVNSGQNSPVPDAFELEPTDSMKGLTSDSLVKDPRLPPEESSGITKPPAVAFKPSSSIGGFGDGAPHGMTARDGILSKKSSIKDGGSALSKKSSTKDGGSAMSKKSSGTRELSDVRQVSSVKDSDIQHVLSSEEPSVKRIKSTKEEELRRIESEEFEIIQMLYARDYELSKKPSHRGSDVRRKSSAKSPAAGGQARLRESQQSAGSGSGSGSGSVSTSIEQSADEKPKLKDGGDALGLSPAIGAEQGSTPVMSPQPLSPKSSMTKDVTSKRVRFG